MTEVLVAKGCCENNVCSWAVKRAVGGVCAGIVAPLIIPAVSFSGGFLYGVGAGLTGDVLKRVGLDFGESKVFSLANLVKEIFKLTVYALGGWALAVGLGVPITFMAAMGTSLTIALAGYLYDACDICCCSALGG